jgi:ethanolamine kinase
MDQDGARIIDGDNRIACGNVRFIPRSYDRSDCRGSALQLILTALPEWSGQQDSIDIIQCTDGITNTLLKVINRKLYAAQEAIEKDAVLLRAYGSGTDVIIDRARETMNHEVLMGHGLAPPLLARFRNGMIYRYIPGTVTRPTDLRTHSISMAIARHLAQWHAVVPCHYQSETTAPSTKQHGLGQTEDKNGIDHEPAEKKTSQASTRPRPNLWTVMQKWISALPVATQHQRMRQASLAAELSKVMAEFEGRDGLGKDGVGLSISDADGSTNVTNVSLWLGSSCLRTATC